MFDANEKSLKKVTLLGATGSIGDASCSLLRLHKDQYEVHGLAAATNAHKMYDLICEFQPKRVALFDEHAAKELKDILNNGQSALASKVEVLSGEQGVIELSGDGQADMVIGAIVGAAGLKPLLAAIKTGCRICLANKEALVMSGQLFFDMAKRYGAQVLPVDSEHSAIFQCLPASEQLKMGSCDLAAVGVREILLTGSGGPFRDCQLSELDKVTPAMAINHPVWSMGPKISVDSATMMNKALEYIEARYLFNASKEQVKVIIHPQSVIHSMVSYVDGAIMAQIGQPDMKTPIALAMSYPQRMTAGVEALDFTKISALTFREPQKDRYPCLFLGMEASLCGQAMTTALNAANEVAVASFLNESLPFVGIAKVVDHVLNSISGSSAYELEEILAIDAQARTLAQNFVASFKS
ncbi:1-deoxy-D-xylulose-5-phosphate reductoisomerase [Anaerobiospirillum sp. NML120448]|uniref:1-deoxy-D-xylulose-5-phosphate reductoisomerase n=1 Tax=Anaerobiospirillum sp. NML120448 TaxID=2932816 RepID=UPI001FF36DF4|nr:1-deoxy-D-xylulose-5-phosphate reductoisomerase [Anaerobiospirillum sp. NML120448]MCK0513452.1 1-deoxy-D-xylulose-5-phosphate reductoisomerase [Anaerobiospirillum sp. NML120448]